MNENTKGMKNEELEEDENETAEGNDAGASGTGEGAGTKKGNGTEDDKKKERTFTQAEVTRMMTREKNQGRSSAYKELGIDPKDNKMVKMFQAFIESQKTDDQKAAEKEAEAQKAQREAEERAAKAEAKAEAMMLGIKPQYVDDAVIMAMSKMTGDNDDLKTILNELKEKYSIWFKDDDDDDDDDDSGKKGKTGQKGTGSTIKENTSKKKTEENTSMGARLAAQRKGTSKSSYWGKNN